MSGSLRCGVRGRLLHGTALAGLIASGVVGFAPAVNAQTILPEGGVVTAGSATISSPAADSLLIEQASPAAIIEWQGFSVGGNATAHFDNGSGATLNRVVGNNPSEIHGTLSATGSLYVVNQAGVTVGPGGRVLTGGSFVPSTHDVRDGDFLAGGDLVFSGSSKAGIVNHGIIRSAMGDVALIARRVENTGEIEALNGTAGLIAGYEVLMREASGADGKFAVRIGGSDTEVVNSGTAATGRAASGATLAVELSGEMAKTGDPLFYFRVPLDMLVANGAEVRLDAGGTLRLAYRSCHAAGCLIPFRLSKQLAARFRKDASFVLRLFDLEARAVDITIPLAGFSAAMKGMIAAR